MNKLTTLANSYGSDKGSVNAISPHRYTYLYELLFHPLREKDINLLEMGLCIGGPELGGSIDRKAVSPSVEMWKSYFPNAHIYGFDISDFESQSDQRFTFIRGDSGNVADLKRLSESSEGFDIIIDDASHASDHQQLALKHLWDRVSEGGYYIIEDLNWQPTTTHANPIEVPKTALFLARYFEENVYLENTILPQRFMQQFRQEVSSFSFFPDFSPVSSKAIKLAVFRKRSKSEEYEDSKPPKCITGASTPSTKPLKTKTTTLSDCVNLLEKFKSRTQQDYGKLSSYSGILSGETVYCIGTGPSLQALDPKSFEELNVIATNNAVEFLQDVRLRRAFNLVVDTGKFGELADVMVRSPHATFVSPAPLTEAWMQKVEANPNFVSISSQQLISEDRGNWSLQSINSFMCDFSLPRKIQHCGQTVIFSAIQLAVFMGASRVILVGVDMDYGRKQTHFRSDIIHANPKYDYDVHARGAFVHFSEKLAARGIRLINATVGGKVDVLPRMTFEDTVSCIRNRDDFKDRLELLKRFPFERNTHQVLRQIEGITILAASQRCYIRGAGKGGVVLAAELLAREVKPEAFIVAPGGKDRADVLGIPLVETKQLCRADLEDALLIIVSTYKQEILDEMLNAEHCYSCDVIIVEPELLLSAVGSLKGRNA